MTSKGAKRQFKSPFQSGSVPRTASTPCDLETLKTRLRDLQNEIDALKNEGLHEDELKVHIDKLHEYNEIKDVAQMVLGRIGWITKGLIGILDLVLIKGLKNCGIREIHYKDYLEVEGHIKANIEGVRTKDLYSKYGLNLDD